MRKDYLSQVHILSRLKKHIVVTDNSYKSECWEWTGNKNKKGYGLAFDGTKVSSAHIIFYLLIKGDYDRTLDLDHLCRIRNCVNPDHLEPVTHPENVRRGTTGIVNRSKTHCPKGHEYTPENTIPDKRRPGRVCRICRREKRNDWGKQNRLNLNAYSKERAKQKVWKERFANSVDWETFRDKWFWCNRFCKAWVEKCLCNGN